MNANLFDRIGRRSPTASRTLIETADGRHLDLWRCRRRSPASSPTPFGARGVVPGDRVAVQVEKTPEALVLYLACLRAGAVYLPLNTAYTLAELAYFIGDAEPRLIVCDPAKRAGLAAARGQASAPPVETLDADRRRAR